MTKISLSRLTDISIGTPEVGAVNFNALHTLLHAMLNRMNISHIDVDYNDEDREFLSPSSNIKTSQIKIIDSEDSEESVLSVKEDRSITKDSSVLLQSPYHRLEEKIKQLDMHLEKLNELPSAANLIKMTAQVPAKTDAEKIMPVQQVWQSIKTSNRITANETGIEKLNDYVSEMMGMFNKTQDSIKDIQDKLGPDPDMQLLKENAAELENIKARLDETDNDMVTWEGLHACLKGDRDRFIRNQSLISSRRSNVFETSTSSKNSLFTKDMAVGSGELICSDFEEAQHEKVADMFIEDKSETKMIGYKLQETESQRMEKRVEEITEKRIEKTDEPKNRPGKKEVKTSKSARKSRDSKGRAMGEKGESHVEVYVTECSSSPDVYISSGESSVSSLPREDIIETLEGLGHVPHIISALVERVDALEDIVKMKGNGIEGTLMERLDSLVDETNRSRIDINNILSGLGEEPSALMQNLAYLKDSLNVHKDEVEEMKKQLATHIANYLRDLDQLRQSMSQAEHVPHPVIQAPSPIHVFASRPPSPPRQLPEVKPSIDPKKFEDLHNEVINLAQIASELMKEGKEQLLKLEEAGTVIEKLQLDKADKDPVWKEIDKKVDKCELDMKVDDATFVDNMGKINDTITELLEKLGMQELDWRDTIDKLNSEINLKLNRKELSSLKTWLETKLKNLNSKIQKANTLDDEAAGIKKQLIQKFNCISCDRPIEMTPSGPVASIPFQGGLPPTKSPRPYTTFELDQIRQHAKNMLQTTTEMGDSYTMDRPCGGSHTVTYPNKRISKTAISNLFRDDGSSIMKPLYKDELEIMGIDGRIYHGRNGRDKLPHVMPSYRPKSAPGEKTPEKKSSPSHHSPHPPSPSALTHSYAVQTSMLDSQLPVEVILSVPQNLS